MVEQCAASAQPSHSLQQSNYSQRKTLQLPVMYYKNSKLQYRLALNIQYLMAGGHRQTWQSKDNTLSHFCQWEVKRRATLPAQIARIWLLFQITKPKVSLYIHLRTTQTYIHIWAPKYSRASGQTSRTHEAQVLVSAFFISSHSNQMIAHPIIYFIVIVYI